jgi:undecaprenyl-diphosphatase
MTAIKYVFLGLIQGLTEFLPVSSSAHLVIFQDLLQIREHQILLDIVLHLGTLSALLVFLLGDIKRLLDKKIMLYILLATALTAIVVILGADFFESMFSSVQGLALPLAITGSTLLCTKKFTRPAPAGAGGLIRQRRSLADLRITDGFWLGIVQGLSVIPGLSRSGLTISALLFRNVEKESAFKFSFLASIPAILGALFLKIEDFSRIDSFEFRYMLFGFVAAFLSGLLALRILLAVIRRSRLHLFGYYCLALALLIWILHCR